MPGILRTRAVIVAIPSAFRSGIDGIDGNFGALGSGGIPPSFGKLGTLSEGNFMVSMPKSPSEGSDGAFGKAGGDGRAGGRVIPASLAAARTIAGIGILGQKWGSGDRSQY